jgi:hypothetical protein
VGSHTLHAHYGGAANFATSDSTTFTVTVVPIDTTTSLGSSSTTTVVGQPVTFTATVTAASGPAPTSGTVNFLDNGNQIGQGAVQFNGTGGVATFVTSTLAVGSHPITAVFVPLAGSTFNTSTSGTVTQTVNNPAPLDTTTAVVTSGTPSFLGQPVTFTATVSAASGTPTGSVTFSVDGTPTTPAPLSGGVATFTTSALGVGAHTITAAYGGATGFNPSASGPVSQTVQVGTTMNLATSASPSFFSQNVTITATVGATGATPQGTVTFKDGGAILSTVPLTTVAGQQQAALNVSSLGIGSHQITAEFTPVVGFLASSAGFTQVVQTIPTSIGLTVGPTTVNAGGGVTITARIAFPANLLTSAVTPTGTVTFFSNGTAIGTAPAGAQPVSITTTTLPTGTDAITAAYGGDTSFGGSTSSPINVTVNAPPPPPPPPPFVGSLVASGTSDGAARRFTIESGQIKPSGGPINPFPGFAGDVRAASGDFNGDGIQDTVMITGPGTKTVMAVVNGKDGSLLVPPTDPFGDANFTFGGFVAAGDIDHDGRAEWVVTPELRGGPRVIIFHLLADGSFDITSPGQPSLVANFFGIGDSAFRDGDRPALGDVNGDGILDVFSIAAFNGGPRTALYDGKDVLISRAAGRDPFKLVGDFFAAPSGQDEGRGGRSIAVGDVNGDGKADLIVTGDNLLGTGNQIVIFSGADLLAGRFPGPGTTPLANFFVAGQPGSSLLSVAAINADGDKMADLAVGSGAGQPSLVKLYSGTNLTGAVEPASTTLDPFGTITLSGVFVG